MNLKSRILGMLVYSIASVLRKTLRVKVIQDGEYRPNRQYLFAFWHGKQFLPVLELIHHQTLRAVLASSSKDGDILEVWLKKLGYEIIRGSSRHNNISAMVAMMRKLKEGASLGFGIDGPIGPLHTVKPGMTHMAQKLQIPIIPVGSVYESKWVFEKAWDKYELPRPFSRALFYLGKPILIAKEENLEEANQRLEQYIHAAEATARRLM
jgi:lysophospholipid acyltransferase (LPLAT)-like uncharacterized protein